MSRADRRRIEKEWQAQFDIWRDYTGKYGDPTCAPKSFRLWHNNGTDVLADAQVVPWMLEHVSDIDDFLMRVKKLATTIAIFLIKLDFKRDRAYWERILRKHYMINGIQDIFQDGHRIIAFVIPALSNEGSQFIVGAGTEQGRWDNILHNTKAITQRVKQEPAHDIRAIVACYGPSLARYLPNILNEAEEGPCQVVSVSASHDFLIKNGIIPAYHVECDPRPHKADNINTPHELTKYLLGSIVHPVLTDKLADYDRYLWHVSGETNFRIRDELEPDAFFVGGGQNVGLRSIGLLYEMGYRLISFYGMDCSFSNEGEIWAGPHASKKDQKDQQIQVVRNGDRQWLTSPIYRNYAAQFFDVMKVYDDIKFRMWGDGLLQAMCAKYSQETAA